jgi:hypothetical protein
MHFERLPQFHCSQQQLPVRDAYTQSKSFVSQQWGAQLIDKDDEQLVEVSHSAATTISNIRNLCPLLLSTNIQFDKRLPFVGRSINPHYHPRNSSRKCALPSTYDRLHDAHLRSRRSQPYNNRMETKPNPTTSPSSTRSPPEAECLTIQDLANETLSEVAEYLVNDPTAFTNLMLTCQRLTGVCEYIRYTSLSVQGSKGRRLLATLISGTPTAARYCKRAKRAWFKYWHEAEMYIMSALMCEALPLMDNLITLRIDAHTINVPHALDRMSKMGLIRLGHHPAFSAESMSRSASKLGGPYSPLTLPSVQNLMISGSYALSYIANHRPLTELNLESFLDYDDLADFVANAEETLLGDTLSILSLKVVRSVDLSTTLPLVSSTFPMLQRLSLKQASMKFTVGHTVYRLARPE